MDSLKVNVISKKKFQECSVNSTIKIIFYTIQENLFKISLNFRNGITNAKTINAIFNYSLDKYSRPGPAAFIK